MKRILITGASPRSFVGSSLCEALADEYTILAPGRAELDLTDAAAVRDYVSTAQLDAVVHCAVNGEGSAGELDADLRMFFALADCRSEYGRLIYLGSGAEFDKRLPMDGITEEAFGRSMPVAPYGFAKYVMNEYARSTDGITNLRLFSGYGPRENWRQKFISGLCCKALTGRPLTVRQDCLFDFVWIGDIVKAVRWAIEGSPAHSDYNLSSGTGVLLSEVAALVKDISGSASPVKVKSPGLARPYVGSNARLANASGIVFTPLRDGLTQMLHYYEKNLANIDVELLSV